MNEPREHDSPIEDYLDELLVTTAGGPRRVRHLLTEVEAHLRDAAEAIAGDGVPSVQAEAQAVARFGPTDLATREPLRRWSSRGMRRRVVLGVLAVGGVAGVFIGVAGALAAAARSIWGARAIGTPFPSGSYTSADCSRWMKLYPQAKDCVAAMTLDHANDFVAMCVLAGILGLVAIAARSVLQRRWDSRAVRYALPAAAEYVVGLAAAGVTAVVGGAMGVDSILVTRGQGAGQPLAVAGAASLAAVLLGVLARRAATTGRWSSAA
ncbi:MAG: hypothetical protein JWM34_1772 [Ilumatobacteraceae bacterium]|nr:hypothetical protein [Ilumatobacteraceae bacterium]